MNYAAHAKQCEAFIRKAYPDAICDHRGAPFMRPAFTNDPKTYASGFYWENMDGDRFYFPTFREAAVDLCRDIGATETELAGE